MELVNGADVFLAFATERDSVSGDPYASVRIARVLDAENRVVRRDGVVAVLHPFSVEKPYPTEAAAWAACAAHLTERAYAMQKKAAECHQKAAAAEATRQIVAVPA